MRRVVLVLLVLAALGCGGLAPSPTVRPVPVYVPYVPPPTASSSADGVGTTSWPIECAGDNKVVVTGAKLVGGTLDPAVRAAGDCQLRLEDCDIESTVPLYAAGGAVVTVVGGRLKGTGGTAVEAAGDAKVLLSGVQVDGRVSQLGSATVDVHPR